MMMITMMRTLLFLLIVNLFSVTTAMADEVRATLLKAADTEAGGEYTRSRFLAMVKKPFDANDPRKKALIIGDSHAQDFLNGILENAYLGNYQLSTRYIPFRCQTFLSDKGEQHIEPKDTALCAESDKLAQARKQIAEADLIILSSRWKEWAADLLPETIRNLALRPDQQLVVIGKKAFGKINVRQYLRMPVDQLRELTNPLDLADVALNRKMQSMLGKDVFVDQQQLICGNTQSCRLFTDDLKLISYDGGHLTPAGARFVGKKIFQGSFLSQL